MTIGIRSIPRNPRDFKLNTMTAVLVQNAPSLTIAQPLQKRERQRLHEIDYVKALAILVVILIHSIDSPTQ